MANSAGSVSNVNDENLSTEMIVSKASVIMSVIYVLLSDIIASSQFRYNTSAP